MLFLNMNLYLLLNVYLSNYLAFSDTGVSLVISGFQAGYHLSFSKKDEYQGITTGSFHKAFY